MTANTGRRVIVIGAGAGGLAAAVDLAAHGVDVTVLERAATVGGKMRQVRIGASPVDAGPTVFTMRWIFESLFADAGAVLSERLTLRPADILARHAWRAGGRLDLFANHAATVDAIAAFAGASDARGYEEFCKRAAGIYQTLAGPFISGQRPSPLDLVRRVGLDRLGDLWRTAPFTTLWSALATHFRDPRLRQLFGRYSTYCGSSPMLAPATLMLIAHVEQDGVWLVDGGMHALAQALQRLAQEQGAAFRCNAEVRRILVKNGRAQGVELASGEQMTADALVFNGDVNALATSGLGDDVARAAPQTPRHARSLSALTWCVRARTAGFPLAYHNVFFAEDYAAEFDAIFQQRDICAAPTVYVCAQDRGDELTIPSKEERLLVLINAPADGDQRDFTQAEKAAYQERAFGLMRACGLDVEAAPEAMELTTPAGFNHLFPATGGALYGRANHGSMASFARLGARTKIPGLYAAGGSVHPGPGVPMAAMSGRLAAASVIADLKLG